ncbi:hypothetical protein RN001_003612, partial [Aquatica leii]
ANKYGTVLEDKKTDRASAENKFKAWENIASEFNATSSASILRSTASLKKCYENRKKELRKTLADERKETLLTGGGPPPKIRRDDTENILLTIMNPRALVGHKNRFHDDAEESGVISLINNEPDVYESELHLMVEEDALTNVNLNETFPVMQSDLLVNDELIIPSKSPRNQIVDFDFAIKVTTNGDSDTSEQQDEECKRRWLYLREKYVKEKNGKSSGSEAVKQWDFFNSLRWLDMHIMKRKTKSNCSKEMQETTSQESQSQDTIEICQEDFSINGEAEEEPIGSRSPVFLNEILISSPSSSRPSTPSTSQSKKRKVNQGNGTLEILDSLQNMGNTVTNMATRILNTKKVEDEDDHFANLINYPTIWYYESLMLILEHAKPKNATYDSISSSETEEDFQDVIEEMIDIDESEHDEQYNDLVDEGDITLVDRQYQSSTPGTSTGNSVNSDIEKLGPTKTRRHNNDDMFLEDASKSINNIADVITTKQQVENSDNHIEHLLNFIGCKLKKITNTVLNNIETTFELAKRKLKIAEEVSDLKSDCEEIAKQKRRDRIRKVLSSDEEDDDDDNSDTATSSKSDATEEFNCNKILRCFWIPKSSIGTTGIKLHIISIENKVSRLEDNIFNNNINRNIHPSMQPEENNQNIMEDFPSQNIQKLHAAENKQTKIISQLNAHFKKVSGYTENT